MAKRSAAAPRSQEAKVRGSADQRRLGPAPSTPPRATAASLAAPNRARPIIEAVRPQVDGGRFPAKAAIGDVVAVEADAFLDGHDLLACEVRYRHESEHRWASVAMEPVGNDRWRGTFAVSELGRHRFAVHARVDHFGTWRRDLKARLEAGQDASADLLVGADLLRRAARRARGDDKRALTAVAGDLADAGHRPPADQEHGPPADQEHGPPADQEHGPATRLVERVLGDDLAELVRRYPDGAASSSGELSLFVDPERARFSTWYELFPRSASPDPDRDGTLADVETRLPYLSQLGIDVLYLPPIHPIGTTSRKGDDGAPVAAPGEPGSPWAIGAPEGGHTAVHPGLGSLDDLDHLVAAAAASGIDVALDLAFQCSPDHPWVHEHPEWFRHRPDGSIRYAENPPKRYEDIFPLDFETEAWRDLWDALLGVVEFWMAHGISVFRVDNPHTKPLRFWEWLISSVKRSHPEAIFLAEAFTRPKVMYRLAKVGFTQSYTYFTWRQARWEIESYLTELTRTEVADYFRPNFWTNTPDILTEQLQAGGPSVFAIRLVLAATLAASYGIYGPAFELQEHRPRHTGSEEYLHSEKYAIRHWDLDRPGSLSPFIGRINRIRRSHPALQFNDSLRFHGSDNEQILVYSKSRPAPGTGAGGTPGWDADTIVMVVNLDPAHRQSGWIDLDLGALGVEVDQPFIVHDLLTDTRYTWEGAHNFVILDPQLVPAHIFHLRPPVPTAPSGRPVAARATR
ncbi:MAG TPA: alpha-1,4-glucan--maltose-1-phosphate maltosyltransferase [Acidimicrobiales bacterium]|nr:alpha-1,4-glucan--maltose-1-phosphate maltosyltransferase [Acidimicrobiales bacterium]